MRLGVCWYPEQEDPATWARAVAMMADEGLEVVRIGDFAWSSYEPARGRFTWRWLDAVVDLLAEHGRRIVVCTPTATPPRWLTAERPEVLLVGPEGRPRRPGSRRHVSLGSPAYREESRRTTTILADRYGDHSAVEAWQLDNEVGNHDSARCFAAHTAQRFRGWLADRYVTVEELNARWGTAFWSQTYSSFEEVELPVRTMTAQHPALVLAHRRFSSHEAVTFVAEQAEIVRSRSPGRLLVANEELGDLHVDVHELAGVVDVVGHDSYPHGAAGADEVALRHELVNGARGDRQGWIVEQQPGAINWTATNPPVSEDDVVGWLRQAEHHGIDTCLLFRWQAARYGQEQYHSGLLRHDGTPDVGLAALRRFRAGRSTARPRPAHVALLFSFDDAWAIETQPHHVGVTHRAIVLGAMEAAQALGVAVDVVPPDRALDRYDVVLAPALHLAPPGRVAALNAVLDRGGTVVLGPRSLVKDADDAWVDGAVPFGLAARLGARVGAFAGWTDATTPQVQPWGVPAGCWTDAYDVTAADVLARYAGGPLGGRPAVVRGDRLVAVGAASGAVWLAVLGELLSRTPTDATT